MARFGRSCESRFRQNFRKAFDWIGFNRSFLKPASGNLVTLAIDPCFISKAGKKTPGIGYFWSGCASAMKRGLEILGIAAVNAYFSKKSFANGLLSLGFHLISRFRDDVRLMYIYQIEFCYRDAKQMTGLTHCQARNREALAFAFNMSLASINVAFPCPAAGRTCI